MKVKYAVPYYNDTSVPGEALRRLMAEEEEAREIPESPPNIPPCMYADAMPLQHGCVDGWTWNRQDRSPEVRLYGLGYRTAHFHPNWSSGTAGVRGTRVLNNGRFFWELGLSQRVFGTSIMIGVCTRQARLHAEGFINLLGEDKQSWGLSHKGMVFHGGRMHRYTKHFVENESTTVGVLFDGIAGTITYYKDGKCLGIAFKGLDAVREPLYPVVCSTAAKTEMTLTSARRDFVNLQDRCRAEIVRRIRERSDIEKLYMPPTIKDYLLEAFVAQPELHAHKTEPGRIGVSWPAHAEWY